ncbi:MULTISPECIES: hypothetical protein [Polyangium]|uniref:Uncharacterized protein n=2 Tax=Polyangium TaxID=55 RepID=A0A4U1JBF8_9BACT|nr:MULTISPECIES: hypothetical protein [Polyangium]MDI1430908.1 hypothetical protein [Polyangium sorediatum]TKD07334.1 hypothetical protein E8A74_17950 [Polyangium fumosum]
MKNLFHLAILIPLASASLYACHDDEESVPAGYEDVVYGGTTTDEALAAFLTAVEANPPANAPSQAPTLLNPPAGALSAATIPTFSWAVGATSRLTPPAPPSLLPAEPRAEPLLAPLAALLGPVRAAHAHGTPFTGYATWLVVSSDADPKLARVFTSETSWKPSDSVWARITAAKATLTVELQGAQLVDNRIDMDGGPFQGSKTTFTITP